jgi:hypothetical protein
VSAEHHSAEQALQRASELFHEIMSAISSKDLLVGCKNDVIAEKLKENLRTRDEIRKIAADGFEVCVLALSEMGASDVTIHECAEQDLLP